MDPVHLFWLFGIGTLVGGGIIGAIAYRNLTPTIKEANNLKAELDEARQEMESYKDSVNSHFDKTSELVNELTQDYVKVYRHLAEGAQALGDGKDFTNVLEQHQGKVLISVDDEPKVQDTIVSEVAPETQEPQGTPLKSSEQPDQVVTQELPDQVVTQENISDGSDDLAAKVVISESPESLAEQGEKKSLH